MPVTTPCPSTPNTAPRHLVVDTNVVLDLLLFRDPDARPVGIAAASANWIWIASQPMRDELEHVLHYPGLAHRLAAAGHAPAQLLAHYDALVRRVAPAPPSHARCKDPDDQKFIDLAVQHAACLVSKDKAVLTLARRLARVGVSTLKPASFVA